MRVGIFTALFGNLSLDETIAKVKSFGVGTVELGTGNYPGGPHCPLDMLDNPDRLKAFQDKMAAAGLSISALSCHGNPLHPEKGTRAGFVETSRKTIQLAAKLGVKTVIDFSGCPGDSDTATKPNWVTCPWPPEYSDLLKWQWESKTIPFWKEHAKFAADHGVRVAIEMHPGFVVYSPETSLPASRPLRDLQMAASIWSLAAVEVEEDVRWNDRADVHLRNHYRLQGWAEMARGVQHHIQQLVEVQESAIEMLLRGHADLNGSPVLQTMVNSVQELRRMGIRLRQFNRLVSTTPAFRPVSLAALVRLAVQRQRNSNPAARFRYSQRPRTVLMTEANVLADPESLLPCISELLQNAVEYGDGRPVLLEIGTEAGMATLAVRNSGAVASTVQQRVFDLFYTTQPDPSRGLGLPIALAIALLHRGSIYCTTSSKCTTMYMTLPLMHP